MKSNILIVGFLKELNDGVCLRLSKELNMYYANVAEMVSYELINADEMITVCGLDYYQDQENKVLRRISSFENTIFCFDYNYFSNYAEKYFSSSCHIIYLKVAEQKLDKIVKQHNDYETWSSAIDIIDFADRNKTLESLCDFTVESDRVSALSYSKKVKEYLKNLYM